VPFVTATALPKSRHEPTVDENFAVAQELRSLAVSVAQSAVARDYSRRPALLARYGERGKAAYLQDTQFHLSYLADAISFGRPSIFTDYLGWVVEVLLARGVATELVGADNYIPMPAPFMGAEDFSYVLQRMPGCMMFLGVMPEGCHDHDHVASCHSNRMILNEDAMAVGIAMQAAVAHRFLTESPAG